MRVLTLGITVALLLACAGGGDAEGDGDEAIGQSDVCAAYLDCLSAVDPTALASVQATYGSSGSCWTDAESAEQCSGACQTGLEQMEDAHPHEDACDDGVLDAYDLDGEWEFEQVATAGECTDQGYVIALEGIWVTWTASSAETLTLDGWSQGEADGHYENNLLLSCTFDGERLECDEVETRNYLTWALAGRWDDDGFDAELALGMISDAGVRPFCTDTVTLRGER